MKIYKIIPLLLLSPFLLGNRGCEKRAAFDHPVLEKGAVCADCHDDGRSPKVAPPGHNITWEKEHGSWMRRYGMKSESTCMMCHQESHCTSCHQTEAPKNHNEFWKLKGHGVAMGLNRGQCSTCHQTDFCERCHEATQPLDHNAAWGRPTNRHCLECHYPITSAGASRCSVCHRNLPAHDGAPPQPATPPHVAGADCRGCHVPLKHIDNGMTCATCHPKQ